MASRASCWAKSIGAPASSGEVWGHTQDLMTLCTSPTAEQLQEIFPQPNDTYLRLGCLAAAEDVPLCVEAARLVVRHAAIVGSTGSGKETSAVASLLQNLVRGGWRAANVVVIDPHGEYASAIGEYASVRSVLAMAEQRLRVPYWALPAGDIVRDSRRCSGWSDI